MPLHCATKDLTLKFGCDVEIEKASTGIELREIP